MTPHFPAKTPPFSIKKNHFALHRAVPLIASLFFMPLTLLAQPTNDEPEPTPELCPEHVCCFECCAGATQCTIFDYLQFVSWFIGGDPCAIDLDTSTGLGVGDIFDFLAFQDEFIDGVINGVPC